VAREVERVESDVARACGERGVKRNAVKVLMRRGRGGETEA
jgi:hypothetical protein